MNDDEPLDFLSKVFCFVLGSDYNKWKNFFVSSLKGRTNLKVELTLIERVCCMPHIIW